MLQGSLENFALDEVLGLLSSTSKTGQLEIAGDRGTGALMFSDGRLVDGTASHTANGTEVEDVMFELLRYADGTFTFTNREVDPGESPQNVAGVLSGAEKRLQDWRLIEAVVPTLDHHVGPAEELPADEVTIARNEWAVLTVIAAGCPASQVCDKLQFGEVEGSRQIKNLAERQLVVVSEPLSGFSAVTRGTGALPARQNETPDLGTETAETPASTTPASTTPGSTTPASTTPGSTTRASTTPAPTTPPPALSGDSGNGGLMDALGDDSLSDGILSIGAMSDGVGPNGLSLGEAATTEAVAAERPPMPPIPTPDELADPAGSPPEPPSPAEISRFGDKVDDLSELVEDAEDSKGGLLARYRKNED